MQNLTTQTTQTNNYYNQESIKKQGLSQDAIEDLKRSGLSDEIIKEAGIIQANKSELERYKIHFWDKNKRQKRFEALYIIPYQVLVSDEDRFCRVKVNPLPEYPEFKGKYTQPPKQHLKDSCHLYILPSEFEKLKSPRCKLAIAEGEKKTLKLIQELRKLEEKLDYKVAVIGISGVNNWQTAPEWKMLNMAGREIILFFDADSEHNKRVVEAELELAGFLYSKGAGVVKSAVWSVNEGKGIDDFLANAGEQQLEKLKGLLDTLMSVFEKYKNRMQDKELLRAFFKHPVRSDKTRLEYLAELVRDEIKIKKKTIENVIKILRIELEEELQEKQQQQIKEVFGLNHINIPQGFLWENGRLKTDKGEDLTDFFVVKEKVFNQNDEIIGLVIMTIKGIEIFVRTEDLGKKSITYIFNKNNTPLDEQTATKVLKYISLYQGYNQIEERKLIEHTGWINDEYYLPNIQLNIDFHEDLKGFESSGHIEKEIELMSYLLDSKSHLALGYVFGFASTLVEPLKANNFTIFSQGMTGKGKTTTACIGLSIFGYHNDLIRNANKTDTGLELFLDKRKDVLNVLDELNTGKGDTVRDIIKLVYDFENGKGRTRARANLTLRKTAEYRGILYVSSEDSLNHLLSKADKTVKGALRRVVIIDFSEFKDVDKEITLRVYNSISENYGNLIKDWISFVKENKKEIIRIYNNWIWELNHEDRGFKFNGQERHLAVLFTAGELIGRIFNVDTEILFDYLWQVAEYNHFEFAEAVELTGDRLKNKIEDFIQNNVGNFEYISITEKGDIIERNIPRNKCFGKIEVMLEDDDSLIYFTSTGLKELAKYIQIPEKELKKLLVSFGFANQDAGNHIIKRTTKVLVGTKMKVYPVSLF